MKDVTDTDHQTAPAGQRSQARAGRAGVPTGTPRPRYRSCQATAAAKWSPAERRRSTRWTRCRKIGVSHSS